MCVWRGGGRGEGGREQREKGEGAAVIVVIAW